MFSIRLSPEHFCMFFMKILNISTHAEPWSGPNSDVDLSKSPTMMPLGEEHRRFGFSQIKAPTRVLLLQYSWDAPHWGKRKELWGEASVLPQKSLCFYLKDLENSFSLFSPKLQEFPLICIVSDGILGLLGIYLNYCSNFHPFLLVTVNQS